MPRFQRFDPAGCGFPRPRAPFLPALRWGDLSLGSDGTTSPVVLDGPRAHHFARGRYALRAAYQAAGAGPSGTVLAPTYHCRTMLDPAFALGARVSFFTVGPNLVPDLSSIRALVETDGMPPKALIVPHYFGLEQPAAVMAELASLCASHGITLVEDCSHAWQVAAQRALEADWSRMIVASPYKFFGCEDGGVLWTSSRISVPAPVTLIDEMMALKTTWSRSRRSVPPTDSAPPPAGSRGAVASDDSDQPSGMYQRALEGRMSLALSRWVMRHTRVAPIIARRRAHYQQWLSALQHVSSARPLFPTIPASCAPYMFPLVIDTPDPHFFQLKQAGLPIWRWDDMAVTDCSTANRYRLHLLHLPCHQDLTAAQMNWMTLLVRKVLT